MPDELDDLLATVPPARRAARGSAPRRLEPPPREPQEPRVDDEITLDQAVERLRQHFGVPRVLVERLLKQESGGRTDAESYLGAQGEFQVLPSTLEIVAKKTGKKLDPSSPIDNAYAGLWLLKDNYTQVRPYAKSERHAWMMAVAGYHGPLENVLADLKRGGTGIPDQGDGLINTQDHVLNIFEGTRPEDFAPDEAKAAAQQSGAGMSGAVRDFLLGSAGPKGARPEGAVAVAVGDDGTGLWWVDRQGRGLRRVVAGDEEVDPATYVHGWREGDDAHNAALMEPPDEVVNSARATGETAPPKPQTFDPYTTEGRQQRDAQAAAESQPGAEREITIRLPLEWSKLTSRDVAELAVHHYARGEGIPDDFTSEWLKRHPEVDIYPRGSAVTMSWQDSPSFDPAARTFRVGAPLSRLSLKRDFEAQRNAVERGADWLLDDSRTAGEKAGDAAAAGAHALDIVTRPLQAASTVVAGEQRNAGALIAAPFSESARDVLKSGVYSPEMQIAAAMHKLRTGETPEGYEQPVAEGLDLLSQLYRREPLNPIVKEAVALGFDPVNYAPLEGVNELGASALSKASRFASRIAEDLPGASKVGGLVERVSRALTDARDPRVEEIFDRGGRVLDLREAAKEPEHFVVTMRLPDGSLVEYHTETSEFVELGGGAPHHSTLQPRDGAGRFAGPPAQPQASAAVPKAEVTLSPGEHVHFFHDGEWRSGVASPLQKGDAEYLAGVDGVDLSREWLRVRGDDGQVHFVARDGWLGWEPGMTETAPPNAASSSAPSASAASAPSAPGVEPEQPLHEFLGELTGRPAPGIQPEPAPATAQDVIGKIARTASDVINLPKSFKSSFALHGPFRQGVFQAAAHPTFLKQAITEQAKAFASEDAFQAFARSIMERPDFKVMQESGLFLPSTYDVEFAGRAPASLREERFASAAAEKIPGVRASGRAYHAAMDALRVQAWDLYTAELAGQPGVTRDTLKALAEFVNVTTGRGVVPVLDRFEWGRRAVAAANMPLWSPRAMASRFNVISPYRLVTNLADPATRPVALLQLRDSMRAATTIGATLGLLSLVPGVRVGWSPYTSEWGKVSVGETHYDLLDGVPATARFVMKLKDSFTREAEGRRVLGHQRPGFIVKDFFRRRMSPSGQAATDWAQGRTVEGEPFTYSKAAADLVTPFVLEDMHQAWLDSGGSSLTEALVGERRFRTGFKGLPKALPSFVGVPSSHYRVRPRRAPRREGMTTGADDAGVGSEETP